MKYSFGFLLATLLLTLIISCNPPSSFVCIRLPNQTTECITDSSKVYWLHLDNGALVMTPFSNLPINLAQYPQFNSPSPLANGTYNAAVIGNEIALSLAQNTTGSIIQRSNAEMGMFFVRSSSGAMMISASPVGCQPEYITLGREGWHIGDDEFEQGVTISTTIVTVDADGTQLFTRNISTQQNFGRTKGTIVVLIDNFRNASRNNPCCDQSAMSCCANYNGDGHPNVPPVTFSSENLPENESYQQLLLFPLTGTCISLSCEYLRVADCASGDVHCYNTALCAADLWVGNCENGPCMAGGVFANGCSDPEFANTCNRNNLAEGHH